MRLFFAFYFYEGAVVKNDKIYLVLILILLAAAGCTSTAVPTPATSVATNPANAAVTPTLACELARRTLDAGAETEPLPPDIIPEQGVNQVDVDPSDVWLAVAQIEAAQQMAANAAEPIDDTILARNATLIRFYHQAWLAELSHSPYPLLTNVFFGDYAAALDIMRTVADDQIFSPSTPLIQGTAAEGNEPWLADYILRQTDAAL